MRPSDRDRLYYEVIRRHVVRAPRPERPSQLLDLALWLAFVAFVVAVVMLVEN